MLKTFVAIAFCMSSLIAIVPSAEAQDNSLPDQLKAAPQPEQQRYLELLQQFGLLKPDQTLDDLHLGDVAPLTNPWCVAACNAAAKIASEYCAGDGLCLSIVEAARQECVKNC